jgi:hypothetical protein
MMPCILFSGGTSRLLSVDHASPLLAGRGTHIGERHSRMSPVYISCQQKPSSKGVTTSQRIKGNDMGGEGWVLDNAKTLRSAPLFLGGASLATVLFNRTFSGIAAVADASR